MIVLNDIIEQASRRPSARRSTIVDDDDGPRYDIEAIDDKHCDCFLFRLKERISDFCTQCFEVMCVWDCCDCYIKLAEFLSIIVFDPFIDLFITLCIVVNTAFMALDHHDMDPAMDQTLQNGNYVRFKCENIKTFPIFGPLLILKAILLSFIVSRFWKLPICSIFSFLLLLLPWRQS